MCENANSSRNWTAGCGESYLSGAGSAGRNSTAESQHGRRPSTPWAQRQEELLRDCIVSPDVFNHMVDRLRDFVAPYVRRDSSLHIATQVDWNSKECSRGQPPYLTSKGRGEHSMAETRKAKRRC